MRGERASTGTVAETAAALRRLVPAGVGYGCAAVRDACAELFDSERPPVARAVDKRRHEYSTGRVLARDALALIGGDAVALPTDGKRRPCWPAGTVGSISHSSGVCAAVAARSAQVAALGLDIERISDVPDGILGRLAWEEEVAELGRDVSAEILPALVFSAREAVFKAYHPATDHYLGYKDVRLSVAGDRFEATLVNPDCPPLFGEGRVAGRYAVAGEMILCLVAIRP